MAVVRYLVLVERDEAGYSVVFPDFPGAGTSGDTFEEALARAEDHIAVHVDGCSRTGLKFRNRGRLKLSGPIANWPTIGPPIQSSLRCRWCFRKEPSASTSLSTAAYCGALTGRRNFG